MYKQRAAALFNKRPERYNCAQAIALAFQDVYDVPEALVKEWKSCGKGKVENGICGALFAAMELVESPEKAQQLAERFEAAETLKAKLIEFVCEPENWHKNGTAKRSVPWSKRGDLSEPEKRVARQFFADAEGHEGAWIIRQENNSWKLNVHAYPRAYELIDALEGIELRREW